MKEMGEMENRSPEDVEFHQIEALFHNRQEIAQPVEETALMVLPVPEEDEEPLEETTARLPEGAGCVILTATALISMLVTTIYTIATGTSPIYIPMVSTAFSLVASIKVLRANT